jgi:hypothetical protein
MESQGLAGQIQVSEATYRRLGDRYEFEDRGEIEVKAKSRRRAYLLMGRRTTDAASQTPHSVAEPTGTPSTRSLAGDPRPDSPELSGVRVLGRPGEDVCPAGDPHVDEPGLLHERPEIRLEQSARDASSPQADVLARALGDGL